LAAGRLHSRFRSKLTTNKAATEDQLDSAKAYVEALVFDMFQLAADLEAQPSRWPRF